MLRLQGSGLAVGTARGHTQLLWEPGASPGAMLVGTGLSLRVPRWLRGAGCAPGAGGNPWHHLTSGRAAVAPWGCERQHGVEAAPLLPGARKANAVCNR